eukprot:767277-Hanusia_phi.AAC.1
MFTELMNVAGKGTESFVRRDLLLHGQQEIKSKWGGNDFVRLGLCPWASGVIDKLRFLLLQAVCVMPDMSRRILVREDITDEDQAKELFIQEGTHLPFKTNAIDILISPKDNRDTGGDWNDFAEVHDLLFQTISDCHETLRQFMEDELENGELYDIGEHVLIAAFHPQYEFGGIEPEEAYLHYEKRAPFPVPFECLSASAHFITIALADDESSAYGSH